MKWKTLGILALLGSMSLGLLSNTADARGNVFMGRNPSTGAVEKYLSFYDTFNGSIVELQYEPRGEGNGTPYIITATGYCTIEEFVVLHGSKEGSGLDKGQKFNNTFYPIEPQSDRFIIKPSPKAGKANKFFEKCIPGTYEYTDGGTLVPSEYAMLMLLERCSSELTHLVAPAVDEKGKPLYSYEFEFISNLHEKYPQINDIGCGRAIKVYFNNNGGTKEYIHTFIVDGQLENIWREQMDTSLFPIYCIDGLG